MHLTRKQGLERRKCLDGLFMQESNLVEKVIVSNRKLRRWVSLVKGLLWLFAPVVAVLGGGFRFSNPNVRVEAAPEKTT